MRCKPTFPSSLPCKIAIVGEAPGKEEELLGVPFVGASGQELTRMLGEAGIKREECYLTNVFLDRPMNNDLENFCGTLKEVRAIDPSYSLPELKKSCYLLPKYIPEIARLKSELEAIKPNLIVALGNTACWALMGTSGINKLRGTATVSTLLRGTKVLPTFHPAAILRDWSNRVIVIVDLIKAAREKEFPEITRPQREVWIDPTLEDLDLFHDLYLKDADIITLDIETERELVKCIGFAPNQKIAIVVPFVDFREPDYTYWKSPFEERLAFRWVEKILKNKKIKLGHNGGIYDVNYLVQVMQIQTNNYSEDTMIMHHALQPELQKSLGFIGSVYTDEASWKLMRERSDEEKKDD